MTYVQLDSRLQKTADVHNHDYKLDPESRKIERERAELQSLGPKLPSHRNTLARKRNLGFMS